MSELSKTEITMALPQADPMSINRAVYGENVEFVYATHFNISLNQHECVIGFGTTQPPDPGTDVLNIKFSHRLHLPPVSAHMLQTALAQLIQAVAVQHAQAAQQAAQGDPPIN